MLPRSPPLPFTHRTETSLPVSGSFITTLELVLPPPKFVILRSEPSRFERYRSSSGSSIAAASSVSQRSSRYCNLVALCNGVTGIIRDHLHGVLGVARLQHCVARCAFTLNPGDVACFCQGAQWISRHTAAFAPLLQRRPYITPECAAQALLSLHCLCGGLQFGKTNAIHHACFGIQLLRRHNTLHGCFHLAFDVVTLIQHECDIREFIPRISKNLVEDTKYLIRIDRSQRQVVVRGATIIEVDTAKQVE